MSSRSSDVTDVLTGLVPSSWTIEGLCAPLGNDQVGWEASGTHLLQKVVQCHPAVWGPRVWVDREPGRGVFEVGHRGG